VLLHLIKSSADSFFQPGATKSRFLHASELIAPHCQLAGIAMPRAASCRSTRPIGPPSLPSIAPPSPPDAPSAGPAARERLPASLPGRCSTVPEPFLLLVV
jgi:hypothetical protein